LHSELANIIAQAKRQAKVAESDVKDDFQAAITEAVAAKEKVREILSALHEGESENRDLQKAIEDVNNSLEQLKKYLQAA
jgi:uncharacterized membrane protein